MISPDVLPSGLFNIAMERFTIFKFGKPSISMGHLYHGELLVITRGYIQNHMIGFILDIQPPRYSTPIMTPLSWI